MTSITRHGSNDRVRSFRECVRSPIRKCLVGTAKFSATRPFLTVLTTIAVSCSLMYYGVQTNFRFETRMRMILFPSNSITETTEKLVYRHDARSKRPLEIKFHDDDTDVTNDMKAANESATSNHTNDSDTNDSDTNDSDTNDSDTNDSETNNSTNVNADETDDSFAAPKNIQLKTKYLSVIIHKNGDDVATIEGMERAFQVVNLIKGLEGYREVCGEDDLDCVLTGPTGFWENRESYLKDALKTDRQVKEALSSFVDRDNGIVFRDMIFGKSEPVVSTEDISKFTKKEMKRSASKKLEGTIHETARSMFNVFKNTNMLELYRDGLEKAQKEFEISYVKSFVIVLEYNSTPKYTPYEERAIEALLKLRDEWKEEDEFNLNVISSGATDKELLRSVIKDIPLMGSAFLIMIVYCCFSLSKFHRIESRSLLGVGAVVSVFLSLTSGFGIMFIHGTPLTPLSYLIPYGLLGLGLDDTFILTGAFERTDRKKNAVDRVVDTINEVGLSIFVTTLTTMVAFFFGSLSSLPGVKWFCLYAMVCVALIIFYQLTFFVAIMVLDDRRRKAQRMDCLICFKCRNTPTNEIITMNEEEDNSGEDNENRQESSGKTFVSVYTRLLLKPFCKVFVLVLFTSIFVGSTFIASGMTQEFDLKETLVKDSFVREYMEDLEEYTNTAQTLQSWVKVVFRDVDVSDWNDQRAMRKYIDDLVEEIPYISSPPVAFWLDDFDEFLYYHSTLRNDKTKSFNEKLDVFLKTAPYDSIYNGQILRDETGTVVSSYTYLIHDQLSLTSGSDMLNAFRQQKSITMNQPINANVTDPSDLHFFAFGPMYFDCEMWAVLVKEVKQTLIYGLATLFVIALIFIPHSIAAFILTPTVFAIFVEVIAVMRLTGLHFDPFSCIGLITCIGIVMDYNLHVFQAYLELEGPPSTRNDKVTKMMECMGRSLIQCGLTNLLGVLPLAFNTSLGYRTVFISFLAFTSVGLANGLVFLPVVLSLVGPVRRENNSTTKENPVEKNEPIEVCVTDHVCDKGITVESKENKDDLNLDALDV